jgi:hypothetical protein
MIGYLRSRFFWQGNKYHIAEWNIVCLSMKRSRSIWNSYYHGKNVFSLYGHNLLEKSKSWNIIPTVFYSLDRLRWWEKYLSVPLVPRQNNTTLVQTKVGHQVRSRTHTPTSRLLRQVKAMGTPPAKFQGQVRSHPELGSGLPTWQVTYTRSPPRAWSKPL